MTDLDKAREWAEEGKGIYSPRSRIKAVIDLIQSLPDQWVDAEEVRKVTDRHNDLIVDFLDQIEGDMHTDTWEAIRDFMCELNVEVDTLAIPKLPTLADMTPEEREACKWMQAKVFDNGFIGILIEFNECTQTASYLCPDGGTTYREYSVITPLPDLPKLQWPGSEVVETPALPEGMRLADHETLGRIVVSQRADEDGDYAFFESIPGGIAGASWGYVHKSELTFLDGDQHA